MAKLQLGHTYTDTQQLGRRDAFHAPAVLCRSEETLHGGDSVMFVHGEEAEVRTAPTKDERHAVVDPLIKVAIRPGTMFWVLLEPQLVQDLVHHFDIEIPVGPRVIEKEDPEPNECSDCY